MSVYRAYCTINTSAAMIVARAFQRTAFLLKMCQSCMMNRPAYSCKIA